MVNVNTVKTWLREGKSAEECRLYAKSEIVSQAVQEFEHDSKSNTAVAVMEPPTEFESRAIPLIERNVPVIPLKPRTKIAFLNSWETKATTDRAQIEQWAKEYPDANVASVAKAEPGGIWIFEVDKQNFHEQVEQQTGQRIPDTFIVRSSPGRLLVVQCATERLTRAEHPALHRSHADAEHVGDLAM